MSILFFRNLFHFCFWFWLNFFVLVFKMEEEVIDVKGVKVTEGADVLHRMAALTQSMLVCVLKYGSISKCFMFILGDLKKSVVNFMEKIQIFFNLVQYTLKMFKSSKNFLIFSLAKVAELHPFFSHHST